MTTTIQHPLGAIQYVAGLAQYRAGNFEMAIERFQNAAEDRGWAAHEIVYSPLAMAFHRNGQAENAR